MPRLQRLLAASSFALLICAGLLLYSAYKDRTAGASINNIARFIAAGGLTALSIKGTRLRHSSPPPSQRDDGPTQ